MGDNLLEIVGAIVGLKRGIGESFAEFGLDRTKVMHGILLSTLDNNIPARPQQTRVMNERK